MMVGYGLRLFGLVWEINVVLVVLEEVFDEGVGSV